MNSLQCEAFQNTIRAAVRQRSIRYSDSYSLTIRWEGDNTSAHQDARNLQNLLAALELPAAHELIILASDDTPGWTVQSELRQILGRAKLASKRALVIVHYAGHGLTGQDGELRFAERVVGTRRELNAERFLISLTMPEEYDLRDVDNVDVLFILDCCYGFAATRAPEVSPRIVEFVTATGPSSPLANAPPRNTVTAKLLGEIRRRQRAGHSYAEIADVVQTLRARGNAIKRPFHSLKLGATSIGLPLMGLADVDPAHIRPALKAVFSVHISGQITQSDAEQFVAWIRSLPESASITLDGMYQTRSVCLILTSAWAVWSKLAGMRGYHLISEITGPNTVGQLHPTSSPASKESMKENQPFGKLFP